MRKEIRLNDGWRICCADELSGEADIRRMSLEGSSCFPGVTWYDVQVPTSVQDALCRCGAIPASARSGAEDLTWIAGKDWVYCRRFSVGDNPVHQHGELCFMGLDTAADIWLNGEKIASHESMYLHSTLDVSRFLKADNTLVIFFRSPVKEIARLSADMPKEWEGIIEAPRLLRKALSDSGTFLGNLYPCTCVGLYDEVFLRLSDRDAGISSLSIDQFLTQNLKTGRLNISADAVFENEDTVRFTVLDGKGEAVASTECPITDGQASCTLEINEPALWWPNNYGPQNLYTVRAELLRKGTCLDLEEKHIGFRLVEYQGDFRFWINHRRIRLWGSNIVNIDGLTHWCDRERLTALMEYAVNGNFNILRVWGEAPLLPDRFYELADEMGLLIWQDFGVGFGPWPDDRRYRELFRAEVTQMVARLRHHPSILLWCGSNETYMVGLSKPLRNGPQYGFPLIFEIAPEVCRQLDPGRLYIPSTPMGGNYPQDATGGDIHGYWGNDFEQGLQYPVLFSESCHATTYAKHSMLRFMTEDEIWPDGHADTHVYHPELFPAAAEKGLKRADSYALNFQNYWRQVSVPDTWRTHLSGFAPSELWDLEDYFDGHDADSLLYRFSVCGADFYKREIERIRRGRPAKTPFEPRRCSGYLTWKYNDAWPHINFTQIDYYLEPTAQYYALKRGFSPILAGVSAEQDHLYLWAVNDSPREVRGEITLRVFSRLCNRIEQEYRYPVRLRPDESRTLDCLDWMGSIPREYILHTAFSGENGEDYGSNVCYLDKERNLTFPKPELTLAWKDGYLEVGTDMYARYVELTGCSEDGNMFGWKFSDNYFDLLPFETKRIRIDGSFDSGTIRAKAFYGDRTTELFFRR